MTPVTIVGDGHLLRVDALVAPDRIEMVATGARIAPPDARAPLVDAFRSTLAASPDAYALGGCDGARSRGRRACPRRFFRRHINEVRYCYAQALASDPTLEGRIEVRFVIAASGTVASAVPESSTLRAPAFESCVASAVRRWIFPAPEGGGVVTVVYPFTFGEE